MKKSKYVTIESPGKIAILGGIMGPIQTPTYLDIDIVISLINSGKVVYEVNPRDITDKTRLTLMNVLTDNYSQSTSKTGNKCDIKLSNAKPSNSSNKQSGVQTSIIDNANSVGIDIFVSNKYS